MILLVRLFVRVGRFFFVPFAPDIFDVSSVVIVGAPVPAGDGFPCVRYGDGSNSFPVRAPSTPTPRRDDKSTGHSRRSSRARDFNRAPSLD